jgi:antirestriction protein ArdC
VVSPKHPTHNRRLRKWIYRQSSLRRLSTESGVVPWRRPWVSTGLPAQPRQQEAISRVNFFLLSASKYVPPFRLMMHQANELGGHLSKGEESTIVAFWKAEDSKESTEDLDHEAADEKTRRHFLLIYYRVLNLEQCELPQRVLDKLPRIEMQELDPIDEGERIIAAMPNPPEIQAHRLNYSPVVDRITLPPHELFTSAEEYYATTLHKIVRYAEFRIIPRCSRRAECSRSAKKYRHNDTTQTGDQPCDNRH